MYVSKFNKSDDFPEIERLIRENGFALLIRSIDGVVQAAHIPLELTVNAAGEKVLAGHVSRANPIWKNPDDPTETLAIFTGPHAYISSSWYDHVNVPTWNYIAVHLYGRIRLIEGEELVQSISAMVDKYESRSANPVSVKGMGEEFVQKEIKGLVGFEISINRVQGAWKLSQNRDEKNRLNVIAELEKLNEHNAALVAEEMRKRL